MNHDRIQTGLVLFQSPWSPWVELAYIRRIDNLIQYAKTPEFQSVEPGAPVERMMSLMPEEAQQLFNQLWILGYRPADGTGDAGHVAALKDHLADMRRIAFQVVDSLVPENPTCEGIVPPYWNTELQCTSETCHRPLPCPVHNSRPGVKP